jgi:hypothetical protein
MSNPNERPDQQNQGGGQPGGGQQGGGQQGGGQADSRSPASRTRSQDKAAVSNRGSSVRTDPAKAASRAAADNHD